MSYFFYTVRESLDFSLELGSFANIWEYSSARDSIESWSSFLNSLIHSLAGGNLGIGGGLGINSARVGLISVTKGAIAGSNLIVTFKKVFSKLYLMVSAGASASITCNKWHLLVISDVPGTVKSPKSTHAFETKGLSSAILRFFYFPFLSFWISSSLNVGTL